MKNLNSICILRLSALGDVCNIIPSVQLLREKYPKARIVWIIGKAEKSLVQNAKLDNIELVVYDKKTGFSGMRKLWKQFKTTKFDALLLMQTSLRANILSLGIKAKLRIGYDWQRSKDGHYFFVNRHIQKATENTKIIVAYDDFLGYLGIKEQNWSWRLQLKDIDLNRFKFVNKPYYILNACASSAMRDLTARTYAYTIYKIYKDYKITCVLTGSDIEYVQNFTQEILQNLQQIIQQKMREDNLEKPLGVLVENLVGKTDVSQLWSLIAKAKFVISPDSAVLHLAAASNSIPLGLYANKDPNYTGAIKGDKYFVNKYPIACQIYFGKAYGKVKFGKSIKEKQAMELITCDEILQKVDFIFKPDIQA